MYRLLGHARPGRQRDLRSCAQSRRDPRAPERRLCLGWALRFVAALGICFGPVNIVVDLRKALEAAGIECAGAPDVGQVSSDKGQRVRK